MNKHIDYICNECKQQGYIEGYNKALSDVLNLIEKQKDEKISDMYNNYIMEGSCKKD